MGCTMDMECRDGCKGLWDTILMMETFSTLPVAYLAKKSKVKMLELKSDHDEIKLFFSLFVSYLAG